MTGDRQKQRRVALRPEEHELDRRAQIRQRKSRRRDRQGAAKVQPDERSDRSGTAVRQPVQQIRKKIRKPPARPSVGAFGRKNPACAISDRKHEPQTQEHQNVERKRPPDAPGDRQVGKNSVTIAVPIAIRQRLRNHDRQPVERGGLFELPGQMVRFAQEQPEDTQEGACESHLGFGPAAGADCRQNEQ